MSVRSWCRSYWNSLRISGLMGRAFRLRDQGRLREAFDVCQQVLQTAGPGLMDFGTVVGCALTIDEIAPKLGQPVLAREPLERALRLLESANANPKSPSELLMNYERRIRARLAELPSAI